MIYLVQIQIAVLTSIYIVDCKNRGSKKFALSFIFRLISNFLE
jgi:hypothetical protein